MTATVITKKKSTLARQLSYDAFSKVITNKGRADDITRSLYQNYKNNLTPLDYKFIKEILYGGLRWYGKISWILQKTSKRDINSLSAATKSALVLGTYQIFYMDKVPDRSAVNESVEYIKDRGEKSAAPYVNGVLRSIARRSEYFVKPDKDKNPADYLSLQYSHPKWMVKRWLEKFGFERTKNLLLANNKIPPCTIRINQDFTKVGKLQEQILKEEKQKTKKQHLPYCLTLQKYNFFTKDSMFSKGMFTIQDEASQLVGEISNPQVGEVILDACLGPGGKSGQAYEAVKGQANIIAIDKSIEQITKAKSNLTRLGHKNITIQQKDFLDPKAFKKGQKFNKILLDAPCSGLGVIRRYPEGKWNKKPSIISNCAKLQRQMLDRSVKLLKDEGEIVYSVCSFEPEESSHHLNYLLEKYKELELVCLKTRVHEYYRRFICRSGELIVTPGSREDMDGFGVFVVKKKKSS